MWPDFNKNIITLKESKAAIDVQMNIEMREINDPDKGLCPEFNANIIKIKDNAYVWMLTFEKNNYSNIEKCKCPTR